jgi:hypothetical protein
MRDLTIDTAAINAVVRALDANDAAQGIDRRDSRMLRVGKVAEEYGEAWAALVGMYAQNPRKGRTHTEGDFVAELFDVALTALVAAASRPEARRFLGPLSTTRPVELWPGMRHLGRRVGSTFADNSDDPVGTLHNVTEAALRLAGTIVGADALADRFTAHVEAKTARLIEVATSDA